MVEKGLQNSIDRVMEIFEEYGFKFKSNEKLIGTLQGNVSNMQDQMVELRE